MSIRSCEVPDCGRPMLAKGWCKPHYQRVSRTGSPGPAQFYNPRKVSEQDRFWSKVTKSTDGSCWEWSAGKTTAGYGLHTLTKKTRVYAHRRAYELRFGEIPDGLVIDHTCWNKSCVNPSHLRAVPQSGNLQNYSGQKTNNTSGVRGVWWDKRRNLWNAEGSVNGVKHYVGGFQDIKEAERAIVAWRAEHHPYSTKDQHLKEEVKQ